MDYPEFDGTGSYPERRIHVWLIRILAGICYILAGILWWTTR